MEADDRRVLEECKRKGLVVVGIWCRRPFFLSEVLLNHSGTVLKRFAPGEMVALSIAEADRSNRMEKCVISIRFLGDGVIG